MKPVKDYTLMLKHCKVEKSNYNIFENILLIDEFDFDSSEPDPLPEDTLETES
jgi:hypothetical protein